MASTGISGGGRSCVYSLHVIAPRAHTIHARTALDFLAVSEERYGGDNPLQIFVRGRVDEGDAEFVGDKPVGLLQMVRTMTQNEREQFKDGHFTAIVGRDHPVKGGGVVALQEGEDMLPDAFAVRRHRLGRPDIMESGMRSPHVVRAHTTVLVAEPGQFGKRQHVDHEIP